MPCQSLASSGRVKLLLSREENTERVRCGCFQNQRQIRSGVQVGAERKENKVSIDKENSNGKEGPWGPV